MENNRKVKAMGNITPTMDHNPRNRQIFDLVCHVNPGNE